MRTSGIFNARTWAALAAATALAVAGCGGGGNGGAAAGVDISGVAAVGAALGGATIEIVDKEGTVVATKTANDDGSYTLTIAATAKPPFVASAHKGDVVLYSPIAEAKTGTINITPITNLMAAQLSPSGDPAALAGEIKAGRTEMNARQVLSVVKALVDALRPLLLNAGADNVDPLTGTFTANGSGIDKVLNSLSIAINKTGSGSNITITVKAAVADGEQPPAIQFTNGQTPPALPDSVQTATLPSSDTDALLADFVARQQACYALPTSSRVNGTGAANVIAPVCREMFSGNDPATYKHNGSIVSSTQAYASLFRDSATGVKSGNPSLDYINANGNLVISYRNTASDGGVSYTRLVVRNEGGAYKAIGNQASYSFVVRPWAESRQLLNIPTYSYWATGFEVNLPNLQSSGSPIFDRVLVTSPNGRVTTYKPNTGLSYLVATRQDGSLSGTSVVRLAGKFMGPTAGSPRNLLGENILWARNPAGDNVDWSDAEIQAINNVGRWKADFFLAGNSGATPDATQYAVTASRPLTPAELSQRVWARLVDSIRADVTTESASSGYVSFADGEPVDLSADGNTDAWEVPANASAPTTVQVQGFTAVSGSPRWNDSVTVSSVARKAFIPCTAQGGTDPHCSSSVANRYAGQAKMNLIQLVAFDARDVEWVTNVGLFKVSMP